MSASLKAETIDFRAKTRQQLGLLVPFPSSFSRGATAHSQLVEQGGNAASEAD